MTGTVDEENGDTSGCGLTGHILLNWDNTGRDSE